MSQIEEPQFMKDNRAEAWFKAGADTVVMIAAAAVLAVGVMVGIASLFFRIGAYQAVFLVVVGTWVALMGASAYIMLTARKTVRTTTIQVDRY